MKLKDIGKAIQHHRGQSANYQTSHCVLTHIYGLEGLRHNGTVVVGTSAELRIVDPTPMKDQNWALCTLNLLQPNDYREGHALNDFALKIQGTTSS
jgi:hypothetical protein